MRNGLMFLAFLVGGGISMYYVMGPGATSTDAICLGFIAIPAALLGMWILISISEIGSHPASPPSSEAPRVTSYSSMKDKDDEHDWKTEHERSAQEEQERKREAAALIGWTDDD